MFDGIGWSVAPQSWYHDPDNYEQKTSHEAEIVAEIM